MQQQKYLRKIDRHDAVDKHKQENAERGASSTCLSFLSQSLFNRKNENNVQDLKFDMRLRGRNGNKSGEIHALCLIHVFMMMVIIIVSRLTALKRGGGN